jgi:hypothetical protein
MKLSKKRNLDEPANPAFDGDDISPPVSTLKTGGRLYLTVGQ